MMSAEDKAKMEKRNKEMKGMDLIEGGPGYWPEQIRFTADQLPEIKKWEVGKEYEITIKCKMMSYELEKKADKKGREHAKFEITAVKSESKYSADQKTIADKMGVNLK